MLELLLGLGAGVGLEVLVYGDEEAGGAGVDAGVLVVERGDEELRGGQGDVDGACAVFLVDADVFGFELAEVDSGDGLAMDDEEDTVAGEEVGEDGAGFGAFDDGVDGVDDGLEAVEALDALDDGRDRGVVDGGAAGDAVATWARMPVVAWRMKTARAAAPRMSARRKATKVPEELRPEEYWVVIFSAESLCLEYATRS